MTAAVPETQQGHHQYIPLAKLQPSPFNRKRFNEEKLKELTENVKLQGVIVPILVRPLPADKFEIVAGERRWRAAKGAQLPTLPAIVRELTDAQAIELQVIENNQREDVHPLEEAEGFERLMKCQKADGAKYTAEDIAVKIGRSRSHVFGRIKLLALCPEARQAFYDEKIDASKALLIARIGHHDTQRQALKDITKDEYGRGPLSYRDAHQHILTNYMLKLTAAPFDTKDTTLLPKAGDCGACPKRTGNQADLFGDVKSADVCTDPKCFDEKRLAHYAVAARALEAKGKKVIYGEDAKKVFPEWNHRSEHWRDELSDRYLPISGHTYVGNRNVEIRALLGDDFVPTLVQHPATGKVVEVASRQAVDAAIRSGTKASKGKAAAKKPAGPKQPDVDDVLTERLASLIHQKAPKQFAKTWIVTLAGFLCEHLSTRDLEAVALAWGWKATAFKSGSYSRRLPAEASKLSEHELTLLMFHMIFAIGPYTRDKVLKLFGIDEAKTRAAIIEERKAARKAAAGPAVPPKVATGLDAILQAKPAVKPEKKTEKKAAPKKVTKAPAKKVPARKAKK